jgi:hypothetical protein
MFKHAKLANFVRTCKIVDLFSSHSTPEIHCKTSNDVALPAQPQYYNPQTPIRLLQKSSKFHLRSNSKAH